jgi:DNA-binding beta-propeller fold protein YncE
MTRSLLAAPVAALLVACGSSPPPAPPPPAPPTAPIAATTVAPPVPAAPATASAEPAPAAPPAPAVAKLTAKPVPLPGVTGNLSFDYLGIDRARGTVWVPVGNTGSADAYDIASGKITKVDGFKTAEREVRGKKRVMGPSAVTVGDGVVYIGNRATSEVCAVDLKTMKVGKCLKTASPTDGVAYVASTKEVWVTTPDDHSLTVLDASKPEALKAKTTVKTPGEVEGYAVDESRGVFFTNLEDKGSTLAVDVKTHAVKATWNPGCNEKGPRGVAVDVARNFVFVACTDHVQVLDAGHDGAKLGKIETGGGVDNLDWIDAKQLLVVASREAARVSLIHVDDKGELSLAATGDTAPGARNAVADANGNVYVPAPESGQLLVLTP